MNSSVYMCSQNQFQSQFNVNIKANAPIGMFDSGVGGLSVALEVSKYLPNENILYYADTAHVPYGARSDEEILHFTAEAIDWLYHQGCKVAVVACNTASAFSLDHLREKYGENFPIIGLVPAVKPAVIQSKSKVVGVLATPATFRGQLIKDVIHNFAEPAGVKVIPVTCLDLVPLVESGKVMSKDCKQVLQSILDPLVDQGADQLVLGCTHYPFLQPAIEAIYGSTFHLIDSGQAVARQCGRVLQKHHLFNNNIEYNIRGINCVVSCNNSDKMRNILHNLLGENIYWKISNLSNYYK